MHFISGSNVENISMNIQVTHVSMAAGCTALLAVVILLLAPGSAYAIADNACLGGENALSRALSSESQGLAHASTTSSILERLTFASTHGGRAEEVPPANDAGDSGEEGTGEGEALAVPPENANENSDNANGGASGGNGGSGGLSGPGGLVRAGDSVSSTNSVNVINTVILRIGSRR